jgi:hypothetical protein
MVLFTTYFGFCIKLIDVTLEHGSWLANSMVHQSTIHVTLDHFHSVRSWSTYQMKWSPCCVIFSHAHNANAMCWVPWCLYLRWILFITSFIHVLFNVHVHMQLVHAYISPFKTCILLEMQEYLASSLFSFEMANVN